LSCKQKCAEKISQALRDIRYLSHQWRDRMLNVEEAKERKYKEIGL